ncbi:hypothetical protein C0992_009302 [Termitomyces sp. T32_za158]|nr:hypothetical protein C0992_009302 [Termitomyces sp. T32_za158]
MQPYGFHHVMRSLFIPLRLTTNARGLEFETELDPKIDQVARRAAYEAMGENEEAICKHMTEHPGVDGIVIGDESRLRQIVTNLASNACKFTSAGGKLSIKTKLILPSNHSSSVASLAASSASHLPYGSSNTDEHPPLSTSHLSRHNNAGKAPGLEYIVVRIEVTDTGHGIKPRDVVRNKLFSAFNQTEQGRQQGGKGSGLGLALVRQIVKLCGGRLGVQSKVDEGSTFWVELPLGVGTKTLGNFNCQASGYTQHSDQVFTCVRSKNIPSVLEGSSMAMVGDAAVAFDTTQVQNDLGRSNSAMQGLMEHGGRVELVLQRHGSCSPVLTRSDRTDLSEKDVEENRDTKDNAEKPSSTFQTRFIRSRPTSVPMPSVQVVNIDPQPTNASNASKVSDPLAHFDTAYTRSSPSSNTPPMTVEPGLPVLVVDDDQVTRSLMTRLLTRLGCHVSTAENGEVALEMILGPARSSTPSADSGHILEQGFKYEPEDKYAIVFLDNQMPVLSGLQAVQRLRLCGRNNFIVGVTAANASRCLSTFYTSVSQLRSINSIISPIYEGVHLFDLDSQLSRKREREVSLEPVSTTKPVGDVDVPRERRDTRTPAKKNRTRLDPTQEENDDARSRSNSNSPPLSTSPPNELKIRVRQISQGVEDISWQNMNTLTSDKDIEADSAFTTVTVEVKKDNDESSDGPADNETTTIEMADSESGDKSLKRKLSERGASQGPPDSAQPPPEPLKRPRDDDENSQNRQEAENQSPPPEQKPPKSPKKASAIIVTPKLSGFMAYASPSSPFAAVKGQNIFASNKAASPPPAQQPTPAPHSTVIGGIKSGDVPSPSTPGVKRTGFEAFASSSSPFATVSRAKSPVLGSTSKLGRAKSPPRRGNSMNSNAFSSYASGLQSFAIPPPKRARAGTPSHGLEGNLGLGASGSTDDVAAYDDGDEDDKDDEGSFSAKLRASKDDDDEGVHLEQDYIYNLTEQDVLTGEEDEQTIHQVRGKLFSLVDGNQWKERGTGLLKLNVKRSDGSGARLVMRKEAVYALLLNVTLFPGMRCSLAQDPRYLRMSVIENGATIHYNLRLANAKIANELLEEIVANIPPA